MAEIVLPTKYFLGANSQAGFISLFDKIYNPQEDWFVYILKGGPGTGKSTLMKRIAKYALDNKIKTEMIYCSSDPDSLDAVIFDELKCCILDGTSPHTVDPKFPGAVETIINLGEFWNTELLIKHKNKIIELTQKNSHYHKRAKNYLSACAQIGEDTNRIVNESIDIKKLLRYTNNLSKRIFENKTDTKPGKEKVRFLSGITPKGSVIFEETVNNICTDVYIIDDERSLVGTIMISTIKKNAKLKGFDVITCYCPMDPLNKIDCLIIPEKEMAFLVSNSWHPILNLKPTKRIHAKRFINNEDLKNKRERLLFNRRVKRELLNEAFSNLKKAKEVHDELEGYYLLAMNYKMIDNVTENLIRSIFVCK